MVDTVAAVVIRHAEVLNATVKTNNQCKGLRVLKLLNQFKLGVPDVHSRYNPRPSSQMEGLMILYFTKGVIVGMDICAGFSSGFTCAS